jgi:biotin--protein ligase
VLLLTAVRRFSASNLNRQEDVPGYDDLIDSIAADETPRTEFLKACLTKLGLEVSQETSSVPSLSRLHLSSIRRGEVGELLHSWNEIIVKEKDEELIRGENDTFQLETPESRWSMAGLKDALVSGSDDQGASTDSITGHSKVVKHIVPHDNAWPETKETPYFNHAVFYSSLQEFRETDREAEEWGDIFMYGEVVTSTNTLLDK